MLGEYDFTQWNGFGIEMDRALHKFDYSEADTLIDNGYVTLKNSLYNDGSKTTEGNIAGKTFVVTGKVYQFKNRDELVKAVEAAGGKVTSSVSKKTDYLVNNDSESTSSKNVKAH
jgi:DNA ligase (NAD+)